MERRNISWLAAFVVAAFALCGGFVTGSWIGVRERGLLKAKGAALVQSEATSQAQLAHAEKQIEELSAIIAKAQNDVDLWQSECERLEAVAAKRPNPVDAFHPPMVLEADAFETQTRIIELECEIALLKELVNQNRTVDGPPLRPAIPGAAMANATQSPTTKAQCSATTKKGTRCSRTARSNGKCWQHGG
jgi:uncharacterized coiled-coil protein SlyX